MRLNLKKEFRNMSSHFFYVQLKFNPKIGTDRVPVTKRHEAVVEVPKDLVQLKQSENTRQPAFEREGNCSCAGEKGGSGHVSDCDGASNRSL